MDSLQLLWIFSSLAATDSNTCGVCLPLICQNMHRFKYNYSLSQFIYLLCSFGQHIISITVCGHDIHNTIMYKHWKTLNEVLYFINMQLYFKLLFVCAQRNVLLYTWIFKESRSLSLTSFV